MKAKGRSLLSNWYIWLISAILGIAAIGVVFVSGTNADMKSAGEKLSDTVNYIMKHCAAYTSLNLATEAKSLVRIVECS